MYNASFYPTPPEVAEKMLAKAGKLSGRSILEPSAAGRTKPCPRAVTAGRGPGFASPAIVVDAPLMVIFCNRVTIH